MDNQLSVCRIHAHIPIQSRTCVRNLRHQLWRRRRRRGGALQSYMLCFGWGSQMWPHQSGCNVDAGLYFSAAERCCRFWLYIDGGAPTRLQINLGVIFESWWMPLGSVCCFSPPFHCLVTMQFKIFVSPPPPPPPPPSPPPPPHPRVFFFCLFFFPVFSAAIFIICRLPFPRPG